MKMNEDDRKQLERFWRRKLWLGMAAIGALGLAAWRVTAVQGRYDEVLIQESRELPEKVYQELIAEVRKGVPIVPVRTELPKKFEERGNRCNAIYSLGVLEDVRAIPELKQLLNNSTNMVTSCFHDMFIGVPSVYTSAFIALGQIKNSRSFDEVKSDFFKLPSHDVINLLKELLTRDETNRRYWLSGGEGMEPSSYSPIPNFDNNPSKIQKIQKIIQSLQPLTHEFRSPKSDPGSLAYDPKFDPEGIRGWFGTHQCFMVKGTTDSADAGGKEAIRFLESLEKSLKDSTRRLDYPVCSGLSMSVYQTSEMKIYNLDQPLDLIQKELERSQSITGLKKESRSKNSQTKAGLQDIILQKKIASLNDKDPKIRRKAVQTLGFINNKKAIPALIRSLNDTDFEVQGLAFSALGNIGDPSAIPAIVEKIKKYISSPKSYIAQMQDRGPGLTMTFSNKDDINSSPIVLGLMPNISMYWRSAPVEALNQLGDVSEYSTLSLLKSSDEVVRAGAIEHLGFQLHSLQIEQKNNKFVKQALINALDDPSHIVRHRVVTAFKRIQSNASTLSIIQDAYPRLVKALPDPTFRSEIISLLNNYTSEINNNDRQTAIAIIDALNSLNIVKGAAIEDWSRQTGAELGGWVFRLSPKLPSTSRRDEIEKLFQTRTRDGTYPNRVEQSRFEVVQILQTLADRNALTSDNRKAALPALMATYKKWSADRHSYIERIKIVRLIRKLNESEKIDRTAQLHTQQLFYLETGILGTIGLTSLILLLTNLRLRNPYPFTWSGYLLFPEEVIAELNALAQRRKAENRSKWQIRLEITYEVLLLLWAFHIAIRIDDRKLPPGGNRSAK